MVCKQIFTSTVFHTFRPTRCVLCKLWVHCSENSPCLKYWNEVDIDTIEDYEDVNYYCPVCIDTLVSYHKTSGEECNVDNLLNCLRSFNLEGVELKSDVEISVLKVVLSEALGN